MDESIIRHFESYMEEVSDTLCSYRKFGIDPEKILAALEEEKEKIKFEEGYYAPEYYH